MTDSMTTILTIEKEASHKANLDTNLSKESFHLLWADSIEQGLELALLHGPDVVLLNSGLSPNSVFDASQRLQKIIRTIGASMILLGEPNTGLAKRSFDNDSVDFLTLPVGKEELLARLNTHLQISRLQRELSESKAKLSGILYHAHLGIAYTDRFYRFNNINEQFVKLFGYVARKPVTLFDLFPGTSENHEKLKHKIEKAVNRRGFFESELKVCHQNGSSRWCKIRAGSIVPGKIEQGMIWSFEDITEKKMIEDELQLAATVYRVTGEAMLLLDIQHQIISINPAFSAMTGFSESDLGQISFRSLILEDTDLSSYFEVCKHLQNHLQWKGELKIRRFKGPAFIAYARIDAVTRVDGSIAQFVCVLSDFTERKKYEEELRFQAEYDALTQLPNRNLFFHRLQLALKGARRYLHDVALLYLDLDKFKWVNDNLGHGRGDEVLFEVAQRLRQCVREVDTVARIGGDEFVIILNGTSQQLIKSTVERILEAINLSVAHNDMTYNVTVSIGVAIFPDDTQDLEKLVLLADQAMYKAKAMGKATYCWHSISD
jgi:diguanylate cyclase (GGDEF)-like protein/PAS domain S-box-containing protein